MLDIKNEERRFIINILEKLKREIEKNPQKIAIETYNKCYSYEEVGTISDFICKLIQDKNIYLQRIALSLAHNEMIIFSILGVLKSGNTYIPLENDNNIRNKDILRQSACSLLLTDNENRNEKDFFEDSQIMTLSIDFILKNFRGEFKLKNNGISKIPYILFTSGSTGIPKGVRSTGNNLNYILKNVLNICQWSKNSKFLFSTSYVFDVSIIEIFGWIECGGSVVILSLKNPKNFKQFPSIVDKYSITHVSFSPSVLKMLFSLIDEVEYQLLDNNLKYISVAGEKFNYQIFKVWKEKKMKINIINFYGPTEATVYATYYLLQKKDNYLNIPIGVPLEGAYYTIENKKQNKGELILYGDGIADGYLNSIESSSFGKDDFGKRSYKTGDIVKEENGQLIFLYRKDSQIQRNGVRVELGEIEYYLNNIDEILLSAVIYKDDMLYAFIKLSNSDSELIISKLQRVLPPHLLPNKFIILSDLPLTSSGKLNRNLLKSNLKDFLNTKNASIKESFNKTELAIREIFFATFKDKYNLEDYHKNIDFYDLGGDSLSSIYFISQLEQKFNINLSLEFLLLNSNLKSISNAIDKENKKSIINNKQKINCFYKINKKLKEKLKIPSNLIRYKITKTHYMQRSYFYKKYCEPLFFEFDCGTEIDKNTIIQALKILVSKNALLRSSLYEKYEKLYFKEYNFLNFKVNSVEIRNLTDFEIIKKIIKNRLKYSRYNNGFLFCFVLCKLKDRYIILGGLDHCIADGASLNILKNKITNLLILGKNSREKELAYSQLCRKVEYWNTEDKILSHPYINKLKKIGLKPLSSKINKMKKETNLLKITNQNILNIDYINLLGAFIIAKKLLISLKEKQIGINLIKNIRIYEGDDYSQTLGDMHSRIPLILYKEKSFKEFYNDSLTIINDNFKKKYFCPRYYIYSNFPILTKKQLELKELLEDNITISYSFLGIVNNKKFDELKKNIKSIHSELEKLGKNKIYATSIMYNGNIYIFYNRNIEGGRRL